MTNANEIDQRFCAAYSDACAFGDPAELYKAMERMHDEFAELLRLYRSHKRESSEAMYVYRLYSTDMSDIAELAFDRFLSMAKNAHTIDIVLRAEAQEHHFQGGVLKYLRKSLNTKVESYALVDCDIAACNCGGKHRRGE